MEIKGLRALCSATKNLAPEGYASACKIQVHIDKSTGKLYWADVVGTGYIQYNDPNMIFIGNIEHPATMAEIREMVEYRVKYMEALE